MKWALKIKNLRLQIQFNQLEGYDLHSTNLNAGRGVIIYTKCEFEAVEECFESKFNEALFCKLKLHGNDKLIIGNIYRSPNSEMENNKKTNWTFERGNQRKLFSHVLTDGRLQLTREIELDH